VITHIAERVQYLTSGPYETGVEYERTGMFYSVSGSKVLHPLGAHADKESKSKHGPAKVLSLRMGDKF